MARPSSVARYRCTGYAFVMFNKYQVAQAVLNELPRALFGDSMRVQRAPEPEDILWENLQYSTRQQCARQVISCIVTCIVVAVGTVALFTANLYVSPGLKTRADSFALFLVLQILSILLLAGGHVIVFAIVPLLARRFERHHTVRL